MKFSIINQCFSVYGACTTGGPRVTVSGAAEAESNSITKYNRLFVFHLTASHWLINKLTVWATVVLYGCISLIRLVKFVYEVRHSTIFPLDLDNICYHPPPPRTTTFLFTPKYLVLWWNVSLSGTSLLTVVTVQSSSNVVVWWHFREQINHRLT